MISKAKGFPLAALLMVALVVISGCVEEETPTKVTTEAPNEEVECIPDWQCGGWSECSSAGKQTRTCFDANACGDTIGQPTQTQTCTCVPDWECSGWSECSSAGKQTRTCMDANSCGVVTGKPAESQSCTPEILEVTSGSYSGNGLEFEISLAEYGNKISYEDKGGNIEFLGAQDGKKLLKFHIIVASIDGEEPFYSNNFQVIDVEGYTYKSVCPIDALGNCKNQDTIRSMSAPILGQKTSGVLMFQVPLDVNKVFLTYMFYSHVHPKFVKFVFSKI